MSDAYEQRGVSSGKEDVHFAIKGLDKGLFPRAFCKVVPDLLTDDDDYCTIMHADGSGTKSSLAYLYWKETGDISVWRGIVQDAIVMNLDDMCCAGASTHFLISNTIGRNKFLIPREVLAEILEGMEAFFHMLREYDIHIKSTGGETADLGDLVRTLVLDVTAICRLPRNEVITNEEIAPGHIVIGLSSYGQTIYESNYNSGISSNGLTNARHDVLSNVYAQKYPESFDPALPSSLVYSGSYSLKDKIDETPLSIGQLLLSPTRTYLPFMRYILREYRQHIKGLVHCTGGGQTKTLKFIQGIHVIKENLFPTPPIFRIIQQAADHSWEEMYRVFNMGHRIEIFLEEKYAPLILKQAERFGIEARVIGRCEASNKNQVSIRGEHGIFIFE